MENKKCEHKNIGIVRSVQISHISVFENGKFSWSEGFEWSLLDTSISYVICSDCKKKWKEKKEDHYPEFIQELISLEEKYLD